MRPPRSNADRLTDFPEKSTSEEGRRNCDRSRSKEMNASALPTPPARDQAVAAPFVPGADPLMPRASGLYDPRREHDSCGVGFVADMKNRKSHAILEKGRQILVNVDHRGAVMADPSLVDGCAVLPQIPHLFFAPECAK